MSYNRNNNGADTKTSYTTNKAPATPVQQEQKKAFVPKAPTMDANGKSTSPAGSLHIQRVGAEQKERITGLFKDVSKAGKEYLRGKDEAGNKYIIFLD